MAATKSNRSAECSFIRGIRTCSKMLEDMDQNASALQSFTRIRRKQVNAVRHTLGQILMRGDDRELDGFCAALTDLAAWSFDYGEYSGFLAEYADRRQRIEKHLTNRRRVADS